MRTRAELFSYKHQLNGSLFLPTINNTTICWIGKYPRRIREEEKEKKTKRHGIYIMFDSQWSRRIICMLSMYWISSNRSTSRRRDLQHQLCCLRKVRTISTEMKGLLALWGCISTVSVLYLSCVQSDEAATCQSRYLYSQLKQKYVKSGFMSVGCSELQKMSVYLSCTLPMHLAGWSHSWSLQSAGRWCLLEYQIRIFLPGSRLWYIRHKE